MLNAERVRKNIYDGLVALGLDIKTVDFNEIWDVIIDAMFEELVTNGQVMDKDDPTTQIGTIK